MTIIEYNLRTIFLHSLVIMGVLWIFCGFYKSAKTDGLKMLCLIGMVIIVFIFAGSMIASIAYSNQIVTVGRVADVTRTGSLGGFLDVYTVFVIQDNGEVAHFHTSLFSSSDLKASVEDLSIGDNIEIYANTILNIIYNFRLR